MITAQVESLTKNLEEIKPLLPLHHKELAIDQDKVPLDPEYSEYLNRDALGTVLYVTLREDGKLVGYFVFFVNPALHNKTCLTAHMDIFYVHPDHRGNGGGQSLLVCSEKELKRRGVQRWYVGEKISSPQAGLLFKSFGFELAERIYIKWIGE